MTAKLKTDKFKKENIVIKGNDSTVKVASHEGFKTPREALQELLKRTRVAFKEL